MIIPITGILFLLLLGVEAEKTYEDKIVPTNDVPPRRGIRCLLPTNGNTSYPKKFLSRKRIRIGVHHITVCTKEWDLYNPDIIRLRIAARHMGPTECVFVTNTDPILAFASDLIDVLGLPESILPENGNAFLYPHLQSDLCIIVKKLEQKNQDILQIFSSISWVAIAFCMMLFAIVLRLIDRNRGIPLEILRNCIFGQFTEHRKRPIVNCLSLMLSVFGAIMVTAFCARFTSFLAISDKAVQPETLDEVNDRVTRVYGVGNFHYAAKYSEEDDLVRDLAHKGFHEWEIEDGLRDVARSSKAAMIMSMESYNMYRQQRLWVDAATGTSLVHLVPQRVFSPSYKAFYVKSGWPHKQRLSTLLQWTSEAGLRTMIENKLPFFRHKGTPLVRVNDRLPAEQPHALKVTALMLPMALLSVGMGLAIVTFVGEVLAHSWKIGRHWFATNGARR